MKYLLVDSKDITPEQLQKVIETAAEFSKGEKLEVYELNLNLVNFGKTKDLKKAIQEQEKAADQKPVEQETAKKTELKPVVTTERKIGPTKSYSGRASSEKLVSWLSGCQHSPDILKLHIGFDIEQAPGILALLVYNHTGDKHIHMAVAFPDEKVVRVLKIQVEYLLRLVNQQVVAINSNQLQTGGANASLVLRNVTYSIANNHSGVESYPRSMSIRTWRFIKNLMNWD